MGRHKSSASKKVTKTSDVIWLGEAWICSKQLKHYPSFCRDNTIINANSFVRVMSPNNQKDNIAYVQDLYENENGEKLVSARWFNFPEETTLPKSETHSNEVLITATEQEMSVECINGIATVLTPNHFEECLKNLPELLSSESFLCYREDRNGCVVPFSLSELKDYDKQFAVSCLSGDEQKTNEKGEGSCKPAVQVYERTKSSIDKRLRIESSKETADPVVPEHEFFKVDDNIEVLCQDSGIRGCWFKCKVLESLPNCLKVRYHDVLDVDESEKLEELVACKVANPDKLGMRCPGRLTVRPFPVDDPSTAGFAVGVAVDAWKHDGWWEGVICALLENQVKVYFPGEKESWTVKTKDIRISKDWVDGKWTSIKPKADILSYMSSKPPPPDDARRKIISSSGTASLKCVEEQNFKKPLPIKKRRL